MFSAFRTRLGLECLEDRTNPSVLVPSHELIPVSMTHETNVAVTRTLTQSDGVELQSKAYMIPLPEVAQPSIEEIRERNLIVFPVDAEVEFEPETRLLSIRVGETVSGHYAPIVVEGQGIQVVGRIETGKATFRVPEGVTSVRIVTGFETEEIETGDAPVKAKVKVGNGIEGPKKPESGFEIEAEEKAELKEPEKEFEKLPEPESNDAEINERLKLEGSGSEGEDEHTEKGTGEDESEKKKLEKKSAEEKKGTKQSNSEENSGQAKPEDAKPKANETLKAWLEDLPMNDATEPIGRTETMQPTVSAPVKGIAMTAAVSAAAQFAGISVPQKEKTVMKPNTAPPIVEKPSVRTKKGLASFASAAVGKLRSWFGRKP